MMCSDTGARAEAWCLLIHAEASLSNDVQRCLQPWPFLFVLARLLVARAASSAVGGGGGGGGCGGGGGGNFTAMI